VEQITIVITESAYSDLEDIENYISQDSPTIARNFISRIFDKIDAALSLPKIGQICA
jgi:plasmid stabilization system protein ParE